MIGNTKKKRIKKKMTTSKILMQPYSELSFEENVQQDNELETRLRYCGEFESLKVIFHCCKELIFKAIACWHHSVNSLLYLAWISFSSYNVSNLRKCVIAVSGPTEHCPIFHFPSFVLRHRRDISTFLDILTVYTMKTIYFLNAYNLGWSSRSSTVADKKNVALFTTK